MAYPERKSTLPVATFNLMNNVAGAGLLTLSAGMAMGVGCYPAVALCMFSGILAGHTFALVNRACESTGETSFQGLCTKLLGREAAILSTAALALLCFAVCIVYSGFIGDVATSLLADKLGSSSDLNGRAANILVATVVALLPLCLQRSLDKLGFTSILGLFSVVYTVGFVVLRSLDGTYAPGGQFFGDLVELGSHAAPTFDQMNPWKFDSKALVLASNLGVSFMAHYNAPRFYSELQEPTMKRCDMVSWPSYIGLSLMYAITMVCGYRTFGRNCRTMLLTNYSPHDRLGEVARLATGCSILFGFPLAFCGLRQGVIETCASLHQLRQGRLEEYAIDRVLNNWGSVLQLRRKIKGDSYLVDRALKAVSSAADSEQGWRTLTTCLLAVTTALAVVVQDMGIVVGIAGAVVGSYFIYILPSLLNAFMLSDDDTQLISKRSNSLLVPFGLFMAVAGVYMNIKARI